MHDLEISWSGGQVRFSPDDSPVLIGRSSSAAVVVPQGTVSRRHLVMTWNGRSWGAEDTSTHGTFDPIGVRLAASWTLGTDVVVRLGSPRGAEISMRLITRALEQITDTDPYADPDSPPTVVDFGPPPPPDQGLGVGGRLLNVVEQPSPAFRPESPPVEPEPVGLDRPSRLEPEPVGLDRPPGPEAEPVAFDSPSRPSHVDLTDGDLVAGADDAHQPDEWKVPGDDVGDHRLDAPAFQPSSEAAGAGYDVSPQQQTLVDTTGGPGIDAPSADRVAAEFGADVHRPDGMIHLDGPPVNDQQEHHQAGRFDQPPPSNQGYGNGHELDHRPHHAAPMLQEQGPGPSGDPAVTFVENDTLRLQLDGEDYVFLPGHEVTVGRDPHCTVTVDERHALVSRRHLRFVHAQGSWWLEDASSKGTYVDGRRLNRPYRSEGAFIANLGDGVAGTQLRVVTSGQHRRPTDRAGLAIAAVAAAALVLAALVAWFVFGGSDDDAAALSTAKRSTVMLLSDSGHGSGFFVSDSLIVTNQHVAAMADQLVVAVSPEEDEPAEIQYVATLVENHPFLDIAVVKITNRAEFNDQGTVTIGEPVDAVDVPVVQLGDSSAVTIGDPVTSTGFPGRFSVSSSDDSGQLRLAPVSTTRGQAANFTSWPGCSAPDLSSFIPPDAPPTVTCSADGNIDKGVLLASFPSGEGASGSAVIHDDKVVAVLFAGDSEDATASRSITTNAFSDWLGSVLSENG